MSDDDEDEGPPWPSGVVDPDDDDYGLGPPLSSGWRRFPEVVHRASDVEKEYGLPPGSLGTK